MIEKIKESRPELQYPCLWQYKVIGQNKELVHETVLAIFQGYSCDVSYSNRSKTGKYHSYLVELTVANEDERDMLYQSLKKSPHIVVVI